MLKTKGLAIRPSNLEFTSEWDFDLAVKEIGYIGQSYNTHRRTCEHRSDFNFNLECLHPFSAKERFFQEVTKAGKELIVIKKTYPSKGIAGNVEAMLVYALRGQLTNSDSVKLSFDFVSQMNPVRNREVAQLILKEFPFNDLEY